MFWLRTTSEGTKEPSIVRNNQDTSTEHPNVPIHKTWEPPAYLCCPGRQILDPAHHYMP